MFLNETVKSKIYLSPFILYKNSIYFEDSLAESFKFGYKRIAKLRESVPLTFKVSDN